VSTTTRVPRDGGDACCCGGSGPSGASGGGAAAAATAVAPEFTPSGWTSAAATAPAGRGSASAAASSGAGAGVPPWLLPPWPLGIPRRAVRTAGLACAKRAGVDAAIKGAAKEQ